MVSAEHIKFLKTLSPWKMNKKTFPLSLLIPTWEGGVQIASLLQGNHTREHNQGLYHSATTATHLDFFL